MKRELYQFYPEVYPFNLWIYVGKDVSGMNVSITILVT